MSTFKSILAATVLGAVLGLGAAALPAQAAGVDFSNPAFAPAGAKTSIPVGAAEFCKSNRGECGVNAAAVDAEPLTDKRWKQLVEINNLINAAIVPVTDEDYYQVAEYWTYPDGYGDCEDFALAKRKALIEAGWPASTLMIAVVRESSGSGHAVLMVRTDRGDLVLDNQNGRVLVWNETPYQYLKRQSQADSGKWVDLVDTRMMMVAQQ
jgi:predicted transglutaminase-like cysteine proteinase